MEDKNSNYLWNKSEKIMTNSIVRKLPIGIQTFEKIREGNYVYVDKTEWVVADGLVGDTVFPKSSP